MTHDDLQDLLALRALGSLETGEAAALEAHLAAGCEACSAELHELERTVGDLGFAVTPVAPPAELRARILAAVQADADRPGIAQVWKTWGAGGSHGDLSIVRAAEGVWETTSPGIEVKRLSLDAERRLATMLVRMAPGTSYPPHQHAHAEECYVLQGDLHFDDVVLRAGDFQRAEARSVHSVQSTEGGCLLFIVSSLEDELLA